MVVDVEHGAVAERALFHDGTVRERDPQPLGTPVVVGPKHHRPGRQRAPQALSFTVHEQEAGRPVDGRRFRMLFTLSGCRPHEEDEWEGRLLRIGEAVVRAGGPVDRCAMTTRDPDTGARDLDTLGLIRSYRGLSERRTLDFGVYGEIVEPGRVRVGDTVEPQ